MHTCFDEHVAIKSRGDNLGRKAHTHGWIVVADHAKHVHAAFIAHDFVHKDLKGLFAKDRVVANSTGSSDGLKRGCNARVTLRTAIKRMTSSTAHSDECA